MPRYGLHLCYTLVTERERERKRERESVCMGWEEEVFESANLRILCEVWISVHQSWVTTGWVPSGLCSKLFGISGWPNKRYDNMFV